MQYLEIPLALGENKVSYVLGAVGSRPVVKEGTLYLVFEYPDDLELSVQDYEERKVAVLRDGDVFPAEATLITSPLSLPGFDFLVYLVARAEGTAVC